MKKKSQESAWRWMANQCKYVRPQSKFMKDIVKLGEYVSSSGLCGLLAHLQRTDQITLRTFRSIESYIDRSLTGDEVYLFPRTAEVAELRRKFCLKRANQLAKQRRSRMAA